MASSTKVSLNYCCKVSSRNSDFGVGHETLMRDQMLCRGGVGWGGWEGPLGGGGSSFVGRGGGSVWESSLCPLD